jgi:hypothetical protein
MKRKMEEQDEMIRVLTAGRGNKAQDQVIKEGRRYLAMSNRLKKNETEDEKKHRKDSDSDSGGDGGSGGSKSDNSGTTMSVASTGPVAAAGQKAKAAVTKESSKKKAVPVAVAVAVVREGGGGDKEVGIEDDEGGEEEKVIEVSELMFDRTNKNGKFKVTWSSKPEEAVEGDMADILHDATEKAVELVWKQYRDDGDVVATVDRMAGETNSLGRKVIPYWPGLEKYAKKHRWGTPDTWKMFRNKKGRVEEKEEEEEYLKIPVFAMLDADLKGTSDFMKTMEAESTPEDTPPPGSPRQGAPPFQPPAAVHRKEATPSTMGTASTHGSDDSETRVYERCQRVVDHDFEPCYSWQYRFHNLKNKPRCEGGCNRKIMDVKPPKEMSRWKMRETETQVWPTELRPVGLCRNCNEAWCFQCQYEKINQRDSPRKTRGTRT